jgi:uncharacterized protein
VTDDTPIDEADSGRGGTRPRRARPVRLLAAPVAAAVVLAAVALGVAVDNGRPATAAAKVACSPTAPKLTVQGTGQSTVTPDLLTVSVEVDASAATAAAALAADNQAAEAAVAAFKGGGVESRDISTSGLSLQPQYAYPRGGPVLTGYQVANAITATISKVAGAGSVIDAVVASAGNALKINSISFSESDPGAVDDQARARAVEQAVAHARAMAAAAGRTLGPVCSLTDQTQLPVQDQDQYALSEPTSAGNAAAVPVETGSQTESAQISLTYLLEPGRR